MRTYVCNVAHSGSNETPLVAPTMEFPLPQKTRAGVVNRNPQYDGQEDANAQEDRPLLAPIWTFGKR